MPMDVESNPDIFQATERSWYKLGQFWTTHHFNLIQVGKGSELWLSKRDWLSFYLLMKVTFIINEVTVHKGLFHSGWEGGTF